MRFFPREHGAVAMLLAPAVCAAILVREWRWNECAVPVAAFAALAAKDPLVVLIRQRFVWKQRHAESGAAARWLAGWGAAFVVAGAACVRAWPFRALAGMGLGLGAFAALAVAVNVRNRQRSALFQVASAAALTSSSLATVLTATGRVAPWCWWFWLITTLQAAAGILVVHARLDAIVALRGKAPSGGAFRRAAWWALASLLAAAIAAAVLERGWIALSLLVAVTGYAYDLHLQSRTPGLQIPLKTVGKRTLALSLLFNLMLIAGFW